MANGLKGKRTITVLLILLALVPTSLSFALNEEKEEKKIEKFIELAERARDKTETLINITYENETAMGIIDDDIDLYDAFMANVSLFDDAVQNITYARENLAVGDYESAIANVTYALEAFRDIFKAIHIILRDSGLAKGELIDAQGLIQAMKRALERIDTLEEIEGLPEEAGLLLEEARLYLNISAAIEDLQLGKVNQTAHNKTQANKLISEAHRIFKKTAGELNAKRMEKYLRTIENLYDRLLRQVEKAIDQGLGADDLNETLVEDIRPIIDEAQYQYGQEDYPAALAQLEDARTELEGVEEGLKDLRQGPKK